SITLTPSASAVVYGTPVTVSVHVGAASGVPAGNVSVSDGVNPLGTFALNASGATSFTSVFKAGTHTISASYLGSSGFNSSSAQPASIVVTPAPLTITADDKSKVYGATVPSLTFAANGFVNGDTLDSLTAQPTVSTTATPASPVGTYPIAVMGAADPNY